MTPYFRPAGAPREGEGERSGQFRAASGKYGKRVNEPDADTQLVALVNIQLNHLATAEMDLRAKTMREQQPSIFSAANVKAFIGECTFVVAFAHPTYTIQFNKIPQTNQLKLFCSNINKDLLFKNKNQQLRNALPAASAFRVQLNERLVFRPQAVMYDRIDAQQSQLVLSLPFSTKQTIELLPLRKCVVYMNILQRAEWTVPPELLRAFEHLPLAAPIAAPHKT